MQNALWSLLVALILLQSSGFAALDILRGARELEQLSVHETGTYTVKNIDYILDFYCEEYNSDGETTAWYAVVPQGGVLVTYILPRDYFESAEAVLYDTYDWLNGVTTERNRYFVAKGTVEILNPEAEESLYAWFSETNGWMREAGVVGEAEDYSEHLSIMAVRVGRIGSVSETAAYIMSGLAALLLAYTVVTVIRFALGKYRKNKDDTEKDPGEEKEN